MAKARNKILRLVKTPPLHGDARAHLMSTIDEEIIPKLFLVHLAPSLRAADGFELERRSTRVPPSEEEIGELARVAATGDLGAALAFIEGLLAEGLSSESVLLGLVRPAARLLSDDWESNGRTFEDAMLGLDTLEQVVQSLVELASSANDLDDR